MGRLYSLNETTLDGTAEMILDEVIDDHDPDEAVLILAKQGQGAAVRHYGDDPARILGLLVMALAGVIMDWLGRAEDTDIE